MVMMSKPKMTVVFVGLLLFGGNLPFAGAGQPRRTEQTRPNVIFVLADDLGYSDLSCYGATQVRTPHLDRLASEGIRFSKFHTAASICSPSRAAFLTGAYPQRCGLYMGINPIRDPHWFLGLHPDEITLAEQFQSQGYRTLLVGKWHLGTEPEFSPLEQGFDDYYGMPCNYHHSPRFYDGRQEVFARTPLDRLTELYTQRLAKFIRQDDVSPFFIYYAHNYPHTPFKPGRQFQGTSADGDRGDVIQEFDWSMGQIRRALDETGMASNTIIIFTSDNGPTNNRYAVPFRGTKYVTFEGGHRVPFIFHWPALIKQGTVSDTDVNAMDLFPTLCEIIHAPLPSDRVYDGLSLTPIFRGKSLARAPADPFYYYNCENLQAIRRGDWKLHLPRRREQVPFWDKNKAFSNLSRPVLFNLRTDPGEKQDVAEAYPDIVRELLQSAENVRAELGEFSRRGAAQRPTGSLFPDAPVISHPRDWNEVSAAQQETMDVERQRRRSNVPHGKTTQ